MRHLWRWWWGVGVTLVLACGVRPAYADLWVHGCAEANVDCIGANSPYDCCTGAGTGTCLVTDTTGIASGSRGKRTIDANERACWTFDNADGDIDSPLFHVPSTASALLCFDADIAAAPVGGGEVQPRNCFDGDREEDVAANRSLQCPNMGSANSATLDGVTDGAPGTQRMCNRAGPGAYYFDVSTVCAAGDVCRAVVIGEPPSED